MADENREVRVAAQVTPEVREDGGIRIEGHASVFNDTVDIAGMFREVVAPGAFSEVIKSDDVRLLIDHEGLPLARTASGTLTLAEDKRGLLVRADLEPTDPDVLRIAPKMKRGDLNQMSIGFTMRGGVQEWDDGEDDEIPLRTIKRVGELFDVSVVTFPAFPNTDVGLRCMAQTLQPRKSLAKRRMMQAQLERGIRVRPPAA